MKTCGFRVQTANGRLEQSAYSHIVDGVQATSVLNMAMMTQLEAMLQQHYVSRGASSSRTKAVPLLRLWPGDTFLLTAYFTVLLSFECGISVKFVYC